jgi:hypothetical protein
MFELVLVDSPGLAALAPDQEAFAGHSTPSQTIPTFCQPGRRRMLGRTRAAGTARSLCPPRGVRATGGDVAAARVVAGSWRCDGTAPLLRPAMAEHVWAGSRLATRAAG